MDLIHCTSNERFHYLFEVVSSGGIIPTASHELTQLCYSHIFSPLTSDFIVMLAGEHLKIL